MGVKNRFKKISSIKNLKFEKKFGFILLEKSLLEFFRHSITQTPGIYLRTTQTFGGLPYKFQISHVYTIFELIYNKKVLSSLYLRNEGICWLVIHVTVIRSLHFNSHTICTIKYGAISNGRFVGNSPVFTYNPYFFCLQMFTLVFLSSLPPKIFNRNHPMDNVLFTYRETFFETFISVQRHRKLWNRKIDTSLIRRTIT